MINYKENIANSGASIYDPINPLDSDRYIPNEELQNILSPSLVGLPLNGYPLRTRSKIVKIEICKALGYPIPNSFKKSQPKFTGQNFDVYIQKSLNVQIWNEEVDTARRYVFLHVNKDDIITAIKTITGTELIKYDHTGKLTKKHQARMNSYDDNICSTNDSCNVASWITEPYNQLLSVSPNCFPQKDQLLRITEVYNRLLPMVGKSINYLNALQERNRGAELHAMICSHLGYSIYEDNGTYPDIAHQLLEVKLQTSKTIDLGLYSPEDGQAIVSVDSNTFFSQDIRYAIFDGQVMGDKIILKKLYLVTGEQFHSYFPLFKGKGINTKRQLPLPCDFFD